MRSQKRAIITNTDSTVSSPVSAPLLLSGRFARVVFILIGWLAVMLAVLGVILPLLPTTPFLLLAAWCFSRSSPRFHHWLLYRSYFGSYLRHWQQYRALPPGSKGKAVCMIIITFAISLFLISTLWVRLLLLGILTGLLVMMWRLPVRSETEKNRATADN